MPEVIQRTLYLIHVSSDGLEDWGPSLWSNNWLAVNWSKSGICCKIREEVATASRMRWCRL